MGKNKYLIVIGGPTASGKTGTAIALAQHFNTHILNADSRQFYKQMSIGTAKPTKEEQQAAPHHFIDFLNIDQPYSVGGFEEDAIVLLNKLYQEKDIAILAGGSGLFLKAICEGLDKFPDISIEVRTQLNKDFDEKGLSFLQEELQRVDPVYYKGAAVENPRRVLRALEVFRASGHPISYFQKGEKAVRNFVPIYIQLNLPREELYGRINKRVDLMMEAGLEKEAESLFVHKDLNALQTVGYKELFDYFSKEKTKAAAVAMIKQNSRRYAKRQLTWFRKSGLWKRFSPFDKAAIIDYLTFVMEYKLQFCRLDSPEVQSHKKADKIFGFKKENEIIATISCNENQVEIAEGWLRKMPQEIQQQIKQLLVQECKALKKS